MSDTYILNIHSPRHKHHGESSELSHPNEESKSSTITADEEKLNFLKTLYFILAVLSIFLSLFSYYTWKHTRSHSILVLSFTSVLCTISAIFGVFGSFRGITDLKYRHLILAGEKEGHGKNFLTLSFFLMILSLALLMVFGSHALFYSERSLSYFQAFYNSNALEFEELFGKSLDELEKWCMLLIMISGYTAYLIIIVMVFITHFAYLLSHLYDSIDRMFEILNLNIMNLGLGMIYITVYCLKYDSNIKFEANVPENVPYAIIIVGVFLCIMCGMGFGTVKAQAIGPLKVYILSSFFMIVICALCSTFAVKSAHMFREGLSEKCFDFMAIVHADYLENLGCSNKYLNTTNIEESTCFKGQIRYIWEPNLSIKDSFGCLNSYCCDVLVTDAKTKFDYLGICASSAIGLNCISLWACYYIWKVWYVHFK